jgi:hypothetical protein
MMELRKWNARVKSWRYMDYTIQRYQSLIALSREARNIVAHRG